MSSSSSESNRPVVLRGADVAPVKRYFMERVILLNDELIRKKHLLDEDSDIETLIIDNIEGTLLALTTGTIAADEMRGLAELNAWREERRQKRNKELAQFADTTFFKIVFRARKSGLFDLREREEMSDDEGRGVEDVLTGRSLVD